MVAYNPPQGENRFVYLLKLGEKESIVDYVGDRYAINIKVSTEDLYIINKSVTPTSFRCGI